MRHIDELSTPTATIQKQVQFPVANLVILNPTAYTVGIRSGNQDIPNGITDTDLFVLPGSFVVYPVTGTEFALSFMEPHLAIQPNGMPERATIIFLDQSENLPSFGAIALTTFSQIMNDSLAVIQSGNWEMNVAQLGAWNVAANITNANIPVTQSGDWAISAIIQNASIDVNQSGAWTIDANITNATLNTNTNITNTEINTSVTNTSIPVTQSGDWIINATIDNASIAVTQSGAWTIDANIQNASINVAQTGDWTIDANITNAVITTNTNITNTEINTNVTNTSIPVAQSGDWDITATIDNATLNVAQSGAWTVNAAITNANIAVTQSGTWNTTILNANIPVTQSGVWNTAISNATIAVTQSGGWTANITNASIAVTQSGTWNMNATITNATLNVAQSGTWNINANITNASINANITNASLTIAGGVNATITATTVNIPVTNPSGAALNINYLDDVLIRNETGHVSGTWIVSSLAIPSGVQSVSLVRLHANVDSIRILGATSGIPYLHLTNADLFTYKRIWTFDVFEGIDSALDIETIAGTATAAPSWWLVGHKAYVPRNIDERGYDRVTLIPRPREIITTMQISASYATHALTQRAIYTVPLDCIAYLKGVYIGIEASTAAATVQGMVEIQTGAGARVHRVDDLRSITTAPQQRHTVTDMTLLPGHTVRIYTTNSDAAAKFFTITTYIEEEQI